MSSPNLNIVTLLGSGLTYTSAYLFGIQEQSLPSGDSMEKLIQVSRGFAGMGTLVHVQACLYVLSQPAVTCTCSVPATACHHHVAQLGCGFHIRKRQPNAFCLNDLCCFANRICTEEGI